jgi:D-aminopeptidase
MTAMLTEVKRVDARTVAFTAGDFILGFRKLRALIARALSLRP